MTEDIDFQTGYFADFEEFKVDIYFAKFGQVRIDPCSLLLTLDRAVTLLNLDKLCCEKQSKFSLIKIQEPHIIFVTNYFQ